MGRPGRSRRVVLAGACFKDGDQCQRVDRRQERPAGDAGRRLSYGSSSATSEPDRFDPMEPSTTHRRNVQVMPGVRS